MFRYYFNFVEIFLANWLKNGHLSAAKTLCKNVQQQLSFLNSIFFRHMSLFSCGLICKIEEAENKFVFLVYEFEFVLWHHSGPENLKKSRQKNLWNQINQIFFTWNCILGSFKLFPSSKIDFWPFLKLQKMKFGQKNFLEIDVFDFTIFFWPGLFSNFLAYHATSIEFLE